MAEERFNKESVYDNEISPLMKQIIEIAQREKIPMACQFAIKDDGEPDGWLFCSTVIDHASNKEFPYVKDMEKVREAISPQPLFFSVMIKNGE